MYEWLKDWDDVCIRGNKKQIQIRRGMNCTVLTCKKNSYDVVKARRDAHNACGEDIATHNGCA